NSSMALRSPPISAVNAWSDWFSEAMAAATASSTAHQPPVQADDPRHERGEEPVAARRRRGRRRSGWLRGGGGFGLRSGHGRGRCRRWERWLRWLGHRDWGHGRLRRLWLRPHLPEPHPRGPLPLLEGTQAHVDVARPDAG